MNRVQTDTYDLRARGKFVLSTVFGISGGGSRVPYRCFEGENMKCLTVRREAT